MVFHNENTVYHADTSHVSFTNSIKKIISRLYIFENILLSIYKNIFPETDF